jgi:lipopolysaccharide transport system ATP-binding protein
MTNEIAIRVQNLSKCYQIYDNPSDRLKQFVIPKIKQLLGATHESYFSEFWALRDVSFEVKRGETVGIIGRNGSGKSTLLQIICGTLTPSTGDVQVSGRVAALLELGSGFNPEFTGRENVYLNAAVLGLSKEDVDARFDKVAAFADIGQFMEQPVKMYSSGMMIRLAFAVIAHVDADILVIDEALAVGDAFFTQKCMRFLRSFMKAGTVLFVSHDTASIRSLCNKAIWLEKGVVLENGSPKDVCENYLEAFYEAQQGKSTTTRMKVKQQVPALDQVDHRQGILNSSNLRNDIEIFHFDADAPSFGQGDAQISTVKFLDENGNALAWITGGEEVTLKVEVMTHTILESPIIGFFVKDNLGQNLFGDNTWLNYMDAPVRSSAGQVLVAEFIFFMPRLSKGNYSITVAVANGTHTEHVQHHWVHDAISFKSETSSLSSGIFGLPMKKIALKVETVNT